MKLLFFLLIPALLLSNNIKAQLPGYNLDFENWDTDSLEDRTGIHGTASTYAGYPDKWVKNPSVRKVLRTADAYSGNYALMLYEWYNGSPNTLVLGDCYDPFFHVGDSCMVTYPQKIYGLSGYYKFYPDSLIPAVPKLFVKTYTTDTLTHKAVLFSSDSFMFMPRAAYGYFNLFLNYPSSQIPDSLSVQFEINTIGMGASLNGFCNFLYLDALEMHDTPYTPLGVEEHPLKKNEIRIYPNPAHHSFQVFMDNADANAAVSICDHLGRCVKTFTHVNGNTVLSTEGIAAGLYFIKITDSNTHTQEIQKLIIQ